MIPINVYAFCKLVRGYYESRQDYYYWMFTRTFTIYQCIFIPDFIYYFIAINPNKTVQVLIE